MFTPFEMEKQGAGCQPRLTPLLSQIPAVKPCFWRREPILPLMASGHRSPYTDEKAGRSEKREAWVGCGEAAMSPEGEEEHALCKKEVTMRYVDGYVIPIPKKSLKTYSRMAKAGAAVWMKHGALDYKECVGEDLQTRWGTPFSRLMKLKRGETVVFSWVVFKLRAHRDRVNANVMKEMEESCGMEEMPFDIKRMVYGGFEVLVEG